MAIDNKIFNKIRDSITPIVSVGVGSAIISVCGKLQLDPQSLQEKDYQQVKNGLIEHYKKFWAHKLGEIQSVLDKV